MSVRSLRVLFIEDFVDDVELVTRALEKASFAVESQVADRLETVTAAIQDREWDLIISDYNLPGFNGEEALKISKKLKPEIPFILLSGAIGEEKAVDLLRAGAADFVSKSNLKRLIPAVERELLAREKAEASRKELINALETMPEGYCAFDSEWNVTFANPKLLRDLGLSLSEVRKKTFFDLMPWPEGQKFMDQYQVVIRTGRPVQFVETLQGRTVQVHAFRSENGGVSIFYRDITDQMEMEAAAQRNAEQFRVLSNSIPQLAWIADADGGVRWLNDRFCEYTGVKAEDLLNWAWGTVHDPEMLPQVVENWKTSVTTGQPFEMQFPLRRADGQYRWFLSRSTPVRDAEGRIIQWLGTNTDIDDELRTREALKNAKAEAERANHLKSAFLANMSHEIRTPLGAILGFADLLRDPNVSEMERSAFIDVITRNGQQLSHIINDILDLSKVEAGHLSVESIETKPTEIVRDVLSLLAIKAKQKDIILRSEIDSSVPDAMMTDPVRLSQILTNVIGNAIKFTKLGSVLTRVFADTSHVHFEVTDTGVGISSQDAAKLFQVFSQADLSITRKYGGTGLGLALSRKLAQALGGDVQLTKSERNKGSTFLISVEFKPATVPSIPLPAQRAPQLAESELRMDGFNVLVIDDSPDNQALIWQILSRRGAGVEVADNGAEGIEKALAGQHDVVLMDIQMPLMDGYTATQKLRENGYDRPIIALTAHAMSEVRLKCLNVGCNDHLPKPINPVDLVTMIGRLVEA